MGNYQCCKSFVRPPTPNELTFHQQQICAKGTIMQQTIVYLSKQDLELFKLAAGCNTVAFMLTLKDRANAFVTDLNRTSLLHCASRSGSPQIIQMLVQQGLDVNLGDASGWTPMHVAVQFQREDNLKILIKLNANPYIKNKSNYTCYQLFENPILKEIATQKLISQQGLNTLFQAKDFRSIREIYKNTVNQKFSDEASIQQRLQTCLSNKIQQQILQHRKEISKIWYRKELLSSTSSIQLPICVDLIVLLMEKNLTLATKYLTLTSCKTPQKISWFLIQNSRRLKKYLFAFLTNFEADLTWDICFQFMQSIINHQQSLLSNFNRVFANLQLRENYFHSNYLAQIFSRAYFSNSMKLEYIEELQQVIFNLILVVNKGVFRKVSCVETLIKAIKHHLSALDISQKSIQQVISYCSQVQPLNSNTVKMSSESNVKIKWKDGLIYDFKELLLFIGKQIVLLVPTQTKFKYKAHSLSVQSRENQIVNLESIMK